MVLLTASRNTQGMLLRYELGARAEDERWALIAQTGECTPSVRAELLRRCAWWPGIHVLRETALKEDNTLL